MKTHKICAAPLALFTLALGASAQASAPVPVNPQASQQARNVLSYLSQITGQFTLSGQQNYINDDAFSNRVNQITGKYPAVWGNDMWFEEAVRPTTTANAKAYWEAGGLVTLSWHACKPTDDEPCDWQSSVQGVLSPEQWTELLTPGTALNNRWRAQVDNMAVYLKQLRDANVPVLWRPYHEANSYFWWRYDSTPENYRALWGMLYDRLVNVHGLNNLLWVWSPAASGDDPTAYYPGDAQVDILGYDIYEANFQQQWHDQLLAIGKNKVITMGEVGDLPTADVFNAQPRWTWFLAWNELLEKQNSEDEIKAIYNNPRVVTRDELPNLK